MTESGKFIHISSPI